MVSKQLLKFIFSLIIHSLCVFIQAKKEIYQVKQERLVIAQEEVQNLNRTLASQWKTSRTSCK